MLARTFRPHLLVAAAALSLGLPVAHATDISGTLNVTASISAGCALTGTGTLGFGSVSPLAGSTATQASTGLSFACTTGINPSLYIVGNNYIAGTGGNSSTQIPIDFKYGAAPIGTDLGSAIALGSGNSDSSSHALTISATLSNYATAPADTYSGTFTVHLVY
jgi:spore coat protein U-like protein